MIYIVYFRFTIGKAYEIFNDGDDIFLAEYFRIQVDIKTQLAVDLITANFTQVITLVAEEQFLNDATCCFIIRRIRTTELAIDMLYRLQFRV